MALAASGSFEISNAEALSYADQLDPGFVSMVGDCLAVSNHDPEATLACAHEWMQVQNSSEANVVPKYAGTVDQATRSFAFMLGSIIPGATVIGALGQADPQKCTPYTPDVPVLESCLQGTVLIAFTNDYGSEGALLAAGVCYAIHDEPVLVTSVICRADNNIPIAGLGQNIAVAPPFVVARPNTMMLEAAGIHPAPGLVSGGSTRVTANLPVPACSQCGPLLIPQPGGGLPILGDLENTEPPPPVE